MKNKIILAIVAFLVGVVLSFVVWNFWLKKDNNTTNEISVTEQEKLYYKEMHRKMYDYYKVLYRNIKIPEDKKDKSIRISLGTLKRKGFPIDEFKTFDGKESCDLSKSFAIRSVENNEYKIKVFYKCGNISNYKTEDIKVNEFGAPTTKKVIENE